MHLCVGALGKLGFVQKNGGGINVSLYDIAGFGVGVGCCGAIRSGILDM